MARRKKYHHYVLVITSKGPVFVTKVNNADRTAEWNMDEKPMELDKVWANDLVLGLTVNMHIAYAVCVPYEITNHPYRYDTGHFGWVEKEA